MHLSSVTSARHTTRSITRRTTGSTLLGKTARDHYEQVPPNGGVIHFKGLSLINWLRSSKTTPSADSGDEALGIATVSPGFLRVLAAKFICCVIHIRFHASSETICGNAVLLKYKFCSFCLPYT